MATTTRKPRFMAGGDDEAAAPMAPRVRRYPCRARGCPMPGTIFTGSTDEEGICAWHFGTTADKLPKVTQVLADWEPLARVVNEGRRFTNDPDRAAAAKGQREELERLWFDFSGFVANSGWKVRVAPRENEHVGDWVRRMERFLNNRVKEAVSGRTIVDDDAPTLTVADMRTRLTGRLKPPAEDFA